MAALPMFVKGIHKGQPYRASLQKIFCGIMTGVMLRCHPRIQDALDRGQPVVALESTVITHGLPKPENLELALELERSVIEQGAVPATVGLIKGVLSIGLTHDDLHYLAEGDAHKASLWNLAGLIAQGRDAGTTVATTLHAAAAVGIRVFATGGIGGVHYETFDESADLRALASYPLITVCAGPKSILDVQATLERLESLGVPVCSYGSDYVAGFHVPETELTAPNRCDSPEEVARLYRSHKLLGLAGGVLVTKAVSEGLSAQVLASYLDEAQKQAEAEHVRGKDTTPFLLAKLAQLSNGESVRVNRRLLSENAALAAQVARAERSLGEAEVNAAAH